MIRKKINSDKTFGSNYDEDLERLYSKQDYPQKDYILLTREQAEILDKNLNRYKYLENAPGLFSGEPEGVVEISDYDELELKIAKNSKKLQIESWYNFAKENYLLNALQDKYVRLGWLSTYRHILSQMISDTVSIRVYEKNTSNPKEMNEATIEVSAIQLRSIVSSLSQAKNLILRKKKQRYFQLLKDAKDVSSVREIEVNYGFLMEEI